MLECAPIEPLVTAPHTTRAIDPRLTEFHMSRTDWILGSLTLLVFGTFLIRSFLQWRRAYRDGELYASTPLARKYSPGFVQSVETLARARK